MKRFLVINTSYFGDTVLTDSLCRNIKKSYPNSEIVFIANKPFVELARYMDGVDKVWNYDKFSQNKGILGIKKFCNLHKNEKGFDAAFVMYGNERGILIARILGAQKVYADNNSCLARFFIDNGRIDYHGLKHVQDQFANMLSLYSGEKVDPIKIKYNVPTSAKTFVRNVLLKGISKKIIIINPTTKSVERDLDKKVAMELIDKISAEGKQAVIVGAGKTAEDYYASLPDTYKKQLVNCINRTSIPELGALLEECEVLISQDTGTMHFALALDVPVVAVFYVNNGEHLAKWAPKDIYRYRIVSTDFSSSYIWNMLLDMLEEVKNGK